MLFQNLSLFQQKPSQRGELLINVRQITQHVEPATDDDRVIELLNRFQKHPRLQCIPILKQGKLCGLVNRHRFMEDHMVGKYGFGHSLNYYKTISSVLEPSFLQVDHNAPVEKVAKLIHTRSFDKLYDDVCVTENDHYLGVVSVSALLKGIMENNLILAIGANPLSGLPGNDFIQRRIRELLEHPEAYDICYLDIDYFKPFNDKYGFAKGDEAIKLVAELLVDETEKVTADFQSFVGHIGGDDFILIASPQKSEEICRNIIARFEGELERFHSHPECKSGFYRSRSRKGEMETFPLLSLSIAIVSTTSSHQHTYAELSSIATEVKKKAKKTPGSAICRNRRQMVAN